MTEDGDKSNAGHVTIYFLLAQGKTHETCSEDLSDAFDQSVEGGLSPSWITSDKALSMKPSKTVLNSLLKNLVFQPDFHFIGCLCRRSI